MVIGRLINSMGTAYAIAVSIIGTAASTFMRTKAITSLSQMASGISTLYLLHSAALHSTPSFTAILNTYNP
jgi:hypothetical protein